jgi:hypothetical protein
VEFDWNFEELMKFEQEAPYCTWMIDQLMKRIWNFKFGISLLSFKDLN